MSVKVAIVEDNAELGEELQHIIAEEYELQCIAFCRNARTALDILPNSSAEVVLMDIRLPDGNGVDLVRQLLPVLPSTQFVMLTMYQDDKHIFDALEAGAIGYLLKDASHEEIAKAIKQAHQGAAPLSGTVARKVVENFQGRRTKRPADSNLTAREKDVIALVSQGLADKQIADRLGISLLTVNSHLKNIYTKLDVHSRAEAISRYFMS